MAKRSRSGARSSTANAEYLTRTPLLAFTAAVDFEYRQPNTSASALQRGKAGERCVTSLRQFANQAIARNPDKFRVLDDQGRLRALPRRQWQESAYSGKRVLFLLPSPTLGGNVATLLFLEAFRERHAPRVIGVFCAGAAVDIYLTNPDVVVYPLWISQRDLKAWDVLIDLGHLEARRDIEIWPVDMEGDLLEVFGLAPSERYPSEARTMVAKDRLHIGVLPLASSPLRTLPIAATRDLCQVLARESDVSLCLNRSQHQGTLYQRALAERLSDRVRVIAAFESIGELLGAVAEFDYAVFADSGPAHMSKLFGTPGVAVYTSAPGDVLQGRFTNLARWTVRFEGAHCRAPCGLAKLRQTAAGEIGCMGSLETTLENLPDTPSGQHPDVVERLLVETPVPCVGRLAGDPSELVAFVLADLKARRGEAQGR